MKRTCNNCRALNSYHGICELGYKIKNVSEIGSFSSEFKPNEECPKPKTNDQLLIEWNKKTEFKYLSK